MPAWRKTQYKYTIYNRAVSEVHFEVGDRMLIYDNERYVLEGQKLRSSWLGPYLVKVKLSPVGYLLEGEVSGIFDRTHINCMANMSPGISEPSNPRKGIFPDTRRYIRKIGGRRQNCTKLEYKVLSKG